MSYKIVVMSCDKNKDLWLPFHHCMEKYWKNHPEIIYSTETIENPYYKTICRDIPIEKWTKRVRETVKELPCKHILLMVDDIFLRDYVDNDKIWKLTELVKDNFASCNLEFSFDTNDIPFNSEFKIRNPQGKYKLSCMCQMWQKQALLKLFDYDTNPWKFEKDNRAKWYDFLISKNGDLLNWGKPKDRWQWGVVQGKWTKECQEFLQSEGIEMNYDERGFYE